MGSIHPCDAIRVRRVEITRVAAGLGTWDVGNEFHEGIDSVAAVIVVYTRKGVLEGRTGICGNGVGRCCR